MDATNIHSDNLILASDHELTVLFDLFQRCYWIGAVAWTFLMLKNR